jgi:hypothetical protein
LRTSHHGGPSSISGNSVNGTGTGVGFPLSARSNPPGCCNTALCVRSVRRQVDSAEQSAFFRAANVTATRHDIRVQGFFRTWQSLKSESAARLQVRIITVDHNQPLQSTNSFSILSLHTVPEVHLAAVTPVHYKRYMAEHRWSSTHS